MLKKILVLLFMPILFIAYAQSVTAEQAEQSNDMKVIATFIKNNPTDPKIPVLKRKLIDLLQKNTKSQPVATPAIKKTTASATPKNSAVSKLLRRKETEDERILNHLFNSNPNSTEALVSMINTSECPVIMKITGKRVYTLTVAPGKKEHILVPKGTYKFSGKICNAPYYSSKLLNGDIELTLGHSKK